MTGMKRLARLVKELEDQLVRCMRCGMCQAVCPLFSETRLEADVARGKLALLGGLIGEIFQNPEGVYERLNRCLLCGSCAANCPSGVDVLDIFMKARTILTDYMGLSGWKKVILRGILAHPKTFDRAMEWASMFQMVFTKPASDRLGTSCARFVSPLLAGRHLKPLASVPFHRAVPSVNTDPGPSGIKVGFFVGCLIDKMFPSIGEAVLDVLKYHGVGVLLPEGEGCCGIPAISLGDMSTFKRLVIHNLERFEANTFDYLVTACATCTSTIKKVWPTMAHEFSDDVRQRIKKISEKAMDINQFLVSKVGFEKGESGETDNPTLVTYHDPCHLKKSLGVAGAPRAIIRANPRYRFKEMAESDWCCGSGGSFNIEYYEISASIGRRKRDNILASGCSVLATGCPACMIQICDMLSQAGASIEVKHPVEIYAEGLSKGPSLRPSAS